MNRSAIPGCIAACLLAGHALADDTELFVTGFDAPAQCEAPNVLFIIDTSGSMGSEVQTQVSWDPKQDFSGCFESDALYFSATGEPPDCGSKKHFKKRENFCEAAAQPLDDTGRYRGLLRAWDDKRERWEPLTDDIDKRPVECAADRGVHGDGGKERYAADGERGPWAKDDRDEPAWASASNVTLFDGNWLNWNSNPPTITRTRLEVAQEVINSVIDSAEQLNVGIMRFNFDEGGPVIRAIEDVGAARGDLKKAIDKLAPDGFTPLSETLYEAGQYLAGRNVDFGDVGPELSVPESRLGGSPNAPSYRSPVQASGQKSYIVLLTDGEPQRDQEADDKIRALPGFGQLVGSDCDGSGEGRCLDDMADYLFKADLRPDLPGKQNVITHTIGFTLDLPLLESTAARGGGRYFVTEDTASLAAALTELAESFTEDGSLFSAPAIPVNAFDRTVSAGDVYVSLFSASNRVRWPGNLKKYRLQTDAAAAGQSLETGLLDRFGQPAVDPKTGFFAAGATSFWSAVTDGNNVALGGAASRLPDPDQRRLLTNIAGDDLNDPAGQNAVTRGNPAITAALLGAPADERDAVIDWARGRDVMDEDRDGDSNEARHAMGDPLHSQPVVVTWGGTAAAPDSTVFLTTNEGYLHAIDAASGDELWAFVPARLLGRLYTLFVNNETGTRSYGLDGQITVHIAGNDGRPGIGAGERVILLFGMRRGGDALFALDVTDRERPRLMWEIDSRTPGYAALGQTWSPPLVRRVDIGGTVKSVVLFGGGYDTGQDNRRFREDTVGNAVFMADLETGAKLWSAGGDASHTLRLDRMRFSIPAPLQTIDLDGDRLTDRVYVGDMGGQLWRFDIVNGRPATDLVEGGVLASLGAADLGASPPAASVRRFYNQADVVPVLAAEKIFLAINLGSGYRAHPLDSEAADQFFSIRDFDVFGVIPSGDYPAPLTVDDLIDVTGDANPVLGFDDAGWRFRLVNAPGEKVLSRSVTFSNSVFFTSFLPGTAAAACAPAGGRNRLYQVSVLSGAALTNFDSPESSGELTIADRSRELSQGGIAPAPAFLFGDNGVRACVGLECFAPAAGGSGGGGFRSFVRSFWFPDRAP
ncbi:MAG: hypothetical protein D6727_08110 [Gammaproteobacteria bacterium]|nr:MAG: hypothetical protein D6727_08110 [Gammaproteobacteria bacterium]